MTACQEEKQSTVDSYIDTLKRLRARILRVRPDMDILEMSSFSTTKLDPTQASEQGRPHKHQNKGDNHLVWMGYSTTSIVLAWFGSLYHLFGPMKQGLRGKHYEDNEEVKNSVKTWQKEQPIQILRGWNTYRTLIKRWNVALERGGDYVEKKKFNPHKISFILMYFGVLSTRRSQTTHKKVLLFDSPSYLVSGCISSFIPNFYNKVLETIW
ncbi:histone-lysine N-methyltransferase SETMAR [Elysia marginata]|uniref:Histone-lysine N-methyltransferase SETMAR n=1 Tax=Elysia marginata TaxID=1093978 RepID=A0AAV4JWL2_9GAST|nr:histone-lysine N-methyltransferase SETMAR [Elysia marginata]